MEPREREHLAAFYDRHPISAAQILAKARSARGAPARLAPEDLFPHDQDHYGGVEAVARLAALCSIGEGSLVLDVCAGLAGPARYLARTFGARVVCVELHAGRAAGAAELNRLVGLDGLVRVVRGDAQALPCAGDRFDAAISQEALLHVPDKRAVLREVHRVLRPGGRLAFTDWLATTRLADDDRAVMWQGIAARDLRGRDEYGAILTQTGFKDVAVEDLTGSWAEILRERFAMYLRLREEARLAGNPAGDDAFFDAYRRFVDLVRARAIGGARFSATK